jgi:hypothetical protein
VFSQKINDTQLTDTIGEQELLAAFEACWFFHNIIHGVEIIIHCGHMNITGAETKLTSILFYVNASSLTKSKVPNLNTSQANERPEQTVSANLQWVTTHQKVP